MRALKRTIILIFLLLSLTFSAYADEYCADPPGYDSRYYDEGEVWDIYVEGYMEGNDEGYSAGYGDGEAEAYEDAKDFYGSESYNKGFSDGYREAKLDIENAEEAESEENSPELIVGIVIGLSAALGVYAAYFFLSSAGKE